MKIEHRPIDVAEIAAFDEAGCLGTAAAITPVESITRAGKEHVYTRGGKAGPKVTALYKRLLAIQLGETDDPYGWTEIIE